MTMGELSKRAVASIRLWSRWFIDRPWVVVAVLAVIGLALRHAWISTQPLSAGDWHWPDNQVLDNYSPWPAIWNGSLGLGGENRFLDAFRFPVYAVSGTLAVLGIGWTFTEKALYFVPFAVLLPVGGWLLAREIMGRTRWTLLTPVLLLGATYFMLEADGEVPLALAEVISFFVLIAFLRAVRHLSLRWALLTGLLLALVAAYDVRPAYLSALLMAMYFVIVALTDRDRHLLLRRTILGGAAAAVFLGSQAFWLIPLLTYHGSAGLPIPQAPNFNVISLGHGLAAADPFWSGGTPAQLVQAPLNPAYMIMPLLALMPMLARRMKPEVLWLTTAALLFAFFAKTDNPPLGGIYDWMYIHIPGWKLFREGSKFLYIVTLAYAILIPMALAAAFEWSAANLAHLRARLLRLGAGVALVGVVTLSAWSVVVLQTGALGSTTTPTPEPASFSAFSTILANDKRPGPVLWLGQPLIGNDIHNHHFLIASPTHPAVNLTGKFASTKINARDPYQLYCADNLIAFCYVDAQLFPYLARLTGAGYVVVPGGEGVGRLPPGITRAWLRQQMESMFGPPTILGAGPTALWVWRMNSPSPAVTTGPAVAVVDSGTWATTASLPALEALDVPATYRASFDNNQYPVARANLPDSIEVMPRLNSACQSDGAATVSVLVESTAPSIRLSVNGSAQDLGLLATAVRLPGWSAYGPFSIAAGETPIVASAAAGTAPTLGPCLSWSSLTAAALGEHSNSVRTLSVTSKSEVITASTASANGKWVELRRYFDPGWRLDTHKPLSLGDGLFNLYHLDAAQSSSATLTFTYSTLPYERIGEVVALVFLIAVIFLIVRPPRRLRFAVTVKQLPMRFAAYPSSGVARWIAGVGWGMLVVTALAVTVEWFGLPSAVPGAAVAPDPYSVDIGYGGVAIGLLLLSLAVRFITGIFAARDSEERPSARVPTSPKLVDTGVATLMIAVVLASCGQSAGDFQNLITQAQQAGSVAPSILGSSLDDARLQRAARQPDLCIADYTQALQQFPTLVAAYVGRGDCYLNGGQNGAAAVHDYTEAILLSPLQADLFVRRAAAYRVIGNMAAAAADYKQAALNPSANDGIQLLAVDGLVAIADYPDARAVYARALVLDPQSSLLYVAGGDLAIALGNDQLADQDYATALQVAVATSSKAQVAQVVSHQCVAEVLRHEYQKAITDCKTAALLSSSGSGAYDDLAAAYLALGNLTTALQQINLAISTFIGNAGPYAQPQGVDGFGLANLYSARGWIEIQLGQHQNAVHDFETALNALPPGAPDARARVKGYLETAKVDP
jgi:tetratricopeptide (TPR) repeat protein